MYAADALWTAVYGALNGNITGGVYDQVPPGASYPYTVLGEATEVPDDLHGREGSDMTGTLHVWSAAPSGAEVDTIMAEIDAALHHADLTVAGARCWAVTRDLSRVMRDQDMETNEPLRHGVVRYRFGLEAT